MSCWTLGEREKKIKTTINKVLALLFSLRRRADMEEACFSLILVFVYPCSSGAASTLRGLFLVSFLSFIYISRYPCMGGRMGRREKGSELFFLNSHHDTNLAI